MTPPAIPRCWRPTCCTKCSAYCLAWSIAEGRVMNERDQVLHAAAELVAAFARNDREAYFGAFSADASFVFYTLEQPLLPRDAYQALWDSWRAEDGFEVLSCASSK